MVRSEMAIDVERHSEHAPQPANKGRMHTLQSAGAQQVAILSGSTGIEVKGSEAMRTTRIQQS
eukprot:1161096-Pelagomonas_calceolata.AAC.10